MLPRLVVQYPSPKATWWHINYLSNLWSLDRSRDLQHVDENGQVSKDYDPDPPLLMLWIVFFAFMGCDQETSWKSSSDRRASSKIQTTQQHLHHRTFQISFHQNYSRYSTSGQNQKSARLRRHQFTRRTLSHEGMQALDFKPGRRQQKTR